MDELLTARQVQELLKIDRTTIYRMLRDGRLVGIKVGQGWRFSRQEVDALLSGLHPTESHAERKDATLCTDVLPLHCIQAVQDVFAEVAQVGSITTLPDGEPVSNISNSCRFCNMILTSQSGRAACVESWRRLAGQAQRTPRFVDCHAGLQYARARIEVNGEVIAMLIAGQFYAASPESDEETARVHYLATRHGLDALALAEAARALPTLDERNRQQIGGWLEKVAQTFSQIGRERAELMDRLRRIAAISILEQG